MGRIDVDMAYTTLSYRRQGITAETVPLCPGRCTPVKGYA